MYFSRPISIFMPKEIGNRPDFVLKDKRLIFPSNSMLQYFCDCEF